VPDAQNQLFIMAGILTATSKFIDREYAKQIKEWIKMTQVTRLYEEEKVEAVNMAVHSAVNARDRQFAIEMLNITAELLTAIKTTFCCPARNLPT